MTPNLISYKIVAFFRDALYPSLFFPQKLFNELISKFGYAFGVTII
jgi:hypothetical protein